MAAPTDRFRQHTGSEATDATNTEAERKGALAGDATVTHGDPPEAGDELDYGTIDISGGAANSAVMNIRWDVTADGGNTLVEDFLLWCLAADYGFTSASTEVKIQPLSGTDNAAPSNTENYVQNAVVGSYTWSTIPATEPGAINLWPTDEGTSMALSTTSDDVVWWATYLAVGSDETTGTYKAADAGKEFRQSFKYSYS